jgi:hypothetical protein
MDYFAGLDISMDETHICVLDREGAVVYEDPEVLPELTDADLEKPGVLLGHRKRLLKAISNLASPGQPTPSGAAA